MIKLLEIIGTILTTISIYLGGILRGKKMEKLRQDSEALSKMAESKKEQDRLDRISIRDKRKWLQEYHDN